ncbi:MAG: endolytic transglycosylase MltG [Gammaproteobacteria bacterium]|nr:endolytic transglycosylase MltG [Gammaproteobacteria bacterium]
MARKELVNTDEADAFASTQLSENSVKNIDKRDLEKHVAPSNQPKELAWRKHLLLWAYILVACLLLRSAFFYQNLHESLNLSNTDQEPVFITVQSGQSFSQISKSLLDQGILKSDFDFQVFARLSGQASQIKAGEYKLEEGMSALNLLDKLVSGDVFYQRIRILEGWTLVQALQEIQSHPNIIASIDINNAEEIQNLLSTDIYPEGMLFPDTYNFTSGEADRDIIERASSLMQEVLSEEWQRRAVGLPFEDSYEALILASIIEKETGRADERELIAGVFINRLQNNMRLQTDPTVIYGLGDRFDGDLTRAHLQEMTAYNTYRIDGLPPTPIALAGREAIRAALNPDLNEYIYFVARGDGSHFFSRTLEEHNAAVDRFQLGNEN